MLVRLLVKMFLLKFARPNHLVIVFAIHIFPIKRDFINFGSRGESFPFSAFHIKSGESKNSPLLFIFSGGVVELIFFFLGDSKRFG